ncbi:MAG: PKD domain-containing protein [Candidatus Nanoarchaeia archaeon]|nr:PKD domain-containing protein [Candidatus Nanoarchaeia archaeon]
MKFSWGLVGVIVFAFLIVLAPVFSAASVTINPANPTDNDALTCLINNNTKNFNAHWKGSGVTKQNIIANPLPASKTKIGKVTCEAYVPNPITKVPVLVGSASVNILNGPSCTNNTNPVFNLTNYNINQNTREMVNLQNYLFDLENNNVSLSVVNDTNVDCSISNNILTIQSNNYYGNASCTIRAADSCNYTDYVLNVNVNFVDTTAPIVSLIDHVIFDEDTNATLDLNNYVNDVDNNKSELTWNYTNNHNIQINIINNVVTFTAAANWSGQEDITFTAYDPAGNYGQDNVRVIVNPVNDMPWINPVIPDQTATEDGAQWTLDLKNYQHDVEVGPLTWLVSNVDNSLLNIIIDSNNIAVFNLVPNKHGNNTITFTLRDAYGANVSQNVLVTVDHLNHVPVINTFSPILNYSLNEGSSQLFTITASDIDSDNLTYSWLLDGVEVSTLNNYTFNALNGPETHSLIANVSDGILSANIKWTINVLNVVPVINASANIVNESQATIVTATATDAGLNDTIRYSFDFNNDGSYEVLNSLNNIANYTWNDNGNYQVKVVADDQDGGVASIIINVQVLDLKPTAVITADPLVQNEGSSLTFYGNNSYSFPDTISTYEWDWNYNGINFVAQDTGISSSHIWMDNGIYNVGLRVIDEDGSTNISNITVTINDLTPSVNFKFSSNNSFIEPSTVSFIDNSTSFPDTIVSWSWDFNNDLVEDSNIQYPTHDFIQNGIYPVTLTVTDEDGSNNSTTMNVVINDTHPLITSLSGNLNILEGTEATFNSLIKSYDGIVNYEWNFNDGNVTNTNLGNINHLFVQNGTYNVVLTVYETDGDYNTSTWNITVQDTLPQVFINSNGTFVDEGQPLQFYGNNSNAYDGIQSYLWNFSDGSTSNLVNPVHVFVNDGVYDVYLTITDNDNSINVTRLSIAVMDVNPLANFTFNPVNPIETDLVSFSDLSYTYDNITNYSWNFGDGNTTYSVQNPSHNYESGNYNITLTVYEKDGDSSSITKNIIVNDTKPVASFSYLPNPASEWDNITFTSTSTYIHDPIVSWLWNFGDSNALNGQIVNHIYNSNGTYNVSLTVTDIDGSVSQTSQLINILNVPVVVSLNANPLNGNEPLNVSFTCTATGNAPFTYSFNFLTGSIMTNSSSFTVNTIYNNGTYNAICNVVDADGDNSYTNQTITVNDLSPSTAFYFVPISPIENETINFTDNSTYVVDPIVSYLWNFGDGNTNISKNPSHNYLQNGIYLVTLTTKDLDGSTNSTTNQIVVGSSALTASIVANNVEKEGVNVQFTGFGTGYDQPLTYSWNFGDSLNATFGNGQIVNHVYTQNGTYTAVLTVTDADGDSVTATHNINITDTIPIVIATANPYSSVVEGISVQFNASNSSAYDLPLTYSWNFGDTFTSILIAPTHIYTKQGNYLVTLTIRDNDGSINSTSFNMAVADAVPVADFTFNPVNPNEGSLVSFSDLSNLGYDGPLTYQWNFGDGSVNDTSKNPTHTYVDNGAYTVVLTVKDSDGSIASDTTPIQVNNVNPIANAKGPYYCGLGNIISLNGTGSDVGNDTLSFAWDLNNDGTYETSGQNVTYNCATEGVNKIALKVTDDDLGSNVNITNVTVYNIVINEFEQNPNPEWFEIYNPSANSIDISGWKIYDIITSPILRHTIPAGTILASNTYYTVDLSANTLNNDGDGLTLRDTFNNIIDETPVLAEITASNNCWARVPNGFDTNSISDWKFQLCAKGITNDIPVNTAPTITSISVTPNPVSIDGLLTCNVATNDVDGDTVTLSYVWTTTGAYSLVAIINDTLNLNTIVGEANGDVITCTVTPNDGTVNGASASSTSIVTMIVPTNNAPTFTNIANQNVLVGNLLTYDIDANDLDVGDILTFSITSGLQAGMNIDSSTGVLTWTPSTANTYPITVQVCDDQAQPNSCVNGNFNIVVSAIPVNNPPTVTVSLSPKPVLVDGLLTCTAIPNDVDGDTVTLSYVWTTTGAYSLAGITTSTLNLNSISEVVGDVITCTVTPNDGTVNGASASDSSTVVIAPPTGQTIINSRINGIFYASEFWWNVPGISNATIYYTNITGPIINVANASIYDSNILNATVYNSTIQLSNITNSRIFNATLLNNVTYQNVLFKNGMDSNSRFISNTSQITLDPTLANNIGSGMISIYGANTNVTNSILTNVIINDSSMDNDGLYNSSITGTTVNNVQLYNATVINGNITKGVIIVKTNGNYYNANIRGSMNISRIINNIMPIVNAGSDQSVNINSIVSLGGSLNDNNGDSLIYNWSQISGPPVTLSDKFILNPTFDGLIVGNYVFQLMADDGIINNSDLVTISVSIPGSVSSGGGSSGGGSSPGELECTEKLINYSQWADCSKDGTTTRTYTKIKKCTLSKYIPITNKTCTYYAPVIKEEKPVIINTTKPVVKATGFSIFGLNPLKLTKQQLMYGGIGLLVLILIILGIYKLTRPKIAEYNPAPAPIFEIKDNKIAEEFVKGKKKK